MGEIKNPLPVKLIVGFIFRQENFFQKAKNILEKRFGRIDLESSTLAFHHTDYYKEEFGPDLKRKFVGFKRLIQPKELPQIKIFTNKIEIKLSQKAKRTINIDPGYLTQSKLILASTKDYRHRIYLAKSIYAEITLFYQQKSFQPWDWTYADYQGAQYIQIFNQLRDIYVKQIKDNHS